MNFSVSLSSPECIFKKVCHDSCPCEYYKSKPVDQEDIFDIEHSEEIEEIQRESNHIANRKQEEYENSEFYKEGKAEEETE